MSPRLVLACASALLALAGGIAEARNTVSPRSTSVAAGEEYEQLSARLDRLATDPVLGRRAGAEIARARGSLLQLKDARRRDLSTP